MNLLPLLALTSGLLLTGCTTILVDEPLGKLVTAEEFDAFGEYYEPDGTRFQVTPTEDPNEFLASPLDESKEAEPLRFRLTALDEEKAFFAWFKDTDHAAWIVTRVLVNLEDGFCLVQPKEQNWQNLADEGELKLEKFRKNTYRIQGSIPESILLDERNWDYLSGRCFFRRITEKD